VRNACCDDAVSGSTPFRSHALVGAMLHFHRESGTNARVRGAATRESREARATRRDVRAELASAMHALVALDPLVRSARRLLEDLRTSAPP
jgi:hypothetical protein